MSWLSPLIHHSPQHYKTQGLLSCVHPGLARERTNRERTCGVHLGDLPEALGLAASNGEEGKPSAASQSCSSQQTPTRSQARGVARMEFKLELAHQDARGTREYSLHGETGQSSGGLLISAHPDPNGFGFLSDKLLRCSLWDNCSIPSIHLSNQHIPSTSLPPSHGLCGECTLCLKLLRSPGTSHSSAQARIQAYKPSRACPAPRLQL